MNNKKERKEFNFTFHMNNGEKVDVKDVLPAETIKEAYVVFKLKTFFSSKIKYSNNDKIVVIIKNKIDFFTIKEV